MKTFLAVLFGILAAAILIYSAVRWNVQHQREEQARQIMAEGLDLAAACKDSKSEDLEQIQQQLQTDEHLVGEVLGWDAENRFDSQLHERGCFQPAPIKANKRRK